MKLEITLDKGDAVLGLVDFEEFAKRAADLFEHHMATEIYQQMPAYYVRANAEEYGWEEGCYPHDFEEAAIATIRWVLRNFQVGLKRGPIELPADVLEHKSFKWPIKKPATADK